MCAVNPLDSQLSIKICELFLHFRVLPYRPTALLESSTPIGNDILLFPSCYLRSTIGNDVVLRGLRVISDGQESPCADI
ncbi:hypothetical protein Mapa_002492 [Marchantia paleacea]|nr:hypothetical protein Mapa_002492 [Marchantia paleacea]